MNKLGADVLVIGSGIAGATCALLCADKGLDVVVITKAKYPVETNTRYAQGGIIWEGINDSVESLSQDIDTAGDEFGSLEAIRILAEEGPELVKEFLIDRLKVPFDRNALGEVSLTREAAHSIDRIIHVGDETGWYIQQALIRELANHHNITLLSGHIAVDLVSNTHHGKKRGARYEPTKILGAYVLDIETNTVKTILASRTVIATGGIGRLWHRTTNPSGACGDGIAMALRAGARVVNMEYMQFHPTAHVLPDTGDTFLISEAVRGEGAVLVDGNDRRFMAIYHPELMELAPRDEVARAIFHELRIGNKVYLDFIPLLERGCDIKARFPQIYNKLLASGHDLYEKPRVLVTPAAHYLCGGILTNQNGETNLGNLYAIGECACTGLHGANRLASTSLLEGLVWGARAAKEIKKKIEWSWKYYWTRFPDEWQVPNWDGSCVVNDDNLVLDTHELLQFLASLQYAMWNNVGIVRNERGLTAAWDTLMMLKINLERYYRQTPLNPEIISLRNAVEVAIEVVLQARRNKESRGCHFRSDYSQVEERQVIGNGA